VVSCPTYLVVNERAVQSCRLVILFFVRVLEQVLALSRATVGGSAAYGPTCKIWAYEPYGLQIQHKQTSIMDGEEAKQAQEGAHHSTSLPNAARLHQLQRQA
jgi:hypothetical protein